MIATIRDKEIHYKNRNFFWQKVERDLWEKETFDVLDKHIVADKVFIDIGAWIGAVSMYAAKLGAKVYAIEPDIVAFDEFINNVMLNDFHIEISFIAISNVNGTVTLNSMTKDGFGNSESSVIDRGRIGNKIDVGSVTLSFFIMIKNINPDDICLIKMDIEGGEILVIKQSKEFLHTYKPKIYIAFHPAWFMDIVKDTQMLVDVLFPVYDVVNVASNKSYSEQEFIHAMYSCCDHSFILIPKQ